MMNRSRFYKATLVLWLLSMTFAAHSQVVDQGQSYPSRCTTVTGTASSDGVSEAFARQMAIRNALKLASMQSNLKVSSTQDVKDFSLEKDFTRFTSQSKVTKFKIVNEGYKDPTFKEQFDKDGMPIENAKSNTYQVTMDVCLTEDPQACDNLPGNYLQPKLAIAQVVTADTRGAADISNLLNGYQIELERRLRNLSYRNVVMLQTGDRIVDENIIVFPNLDIETLAPLRENTGAQYVLFTVIRSLSRHNEDSETWQNVKRFYNLEVRPNARYIEVDSYVVDLNSYKIVNQKRYGFDVKSDESVLVGRSRPFGTNAFFATDTGMGFHAMLEQQTREVYNFLNCKPVTTQIIDIRGDDYILYLSEDSGARPGDEMAIYHKFGRPVRYQNVLLGLDSEPSGFLKIKRIQANFAVGEIIAKEGNIAIGDVVKSW